MASTTVVDNETTLQALLATSTKPPLTSADFEGVGDRTVVLNFDVNGTILAADSYQDYGPEQMATIALSKVVIDVWEPGTEEMSFWEYVFTHGIPGKKNDEGLKPARREMLQTLLTRLADKPYCATAMKVHGAVVERLSAQQTQVIPAFYRLIELLREAGKTVRVQLRTFGDDGEKVVEEIKGRLGLDFVQLTMRDEGIYANAAGEVVATTASELHALMLENHHLVKGNWERWNKNGQLFAFGKVFPFDTKVKDSVDIFVDDNVVRPGSTVESIVCPAPINGDEDPTPDSWIGKHVFQASLLRSQLDPDDFGRMLLAAAKEGSGK